MIVIVGGGISGLTLAWHLQKMEKPYMLLEGSPRFGGHIETQVENGLVMDTGPNTLLADEVVQDFVQKLGLKNEVLFPNPVAKNRFIYRNGRLHGLSPSPFSLLTTKLISYKSKWKIWNERNVEARHLPNETLADLVRRRFDPELLDWVVSPIQAGIFAADPEELMVADAFPKMVEWEKKYGSIVKGMMKSGGGNRAKTLNFKEGMQALPKQIAGQLSNAISLAPVQSIKSKNEKWRVEWVENSITKEVLADQVVCCLPSYQAASLFTDFSAVASCLLQIEYADMAMVHTAVNQTDTSFPFAGFGGLIPQRAGFVCSGSIWASSVFENRAPDGTHLLAQFAGGAMRPEVSLWSDVEILKRINEENRTLFQIENPEYQKITQWKNGLPQYNLKRKTAVENLDKITPAGIHFLSNWKGGIGLSDCIRNAIALSSQL